MNNTWSTEQLNQIWLNYLHGKMLTLFPINLSSRNPFALRYEGVSLNGKWVKAEIPLYALDAVCPKCGKLMHFDFFEESNFSNVSWSVDFQDNNLENFSLENLWPMHEQCIEEKKQAALNNQRQLQSNVLEKN